METFLVLRLSRAHAVSPLSRTPPPLSPPGPATLLPWETPYNSRCLSNRKFCPRAEALIFVPDSARNNVWDMKTNFSPLFPLNPLLGLVLTIQIFLEFGVVLEFNYFVHMRLLYVVLVFLIIVLLFLIFLTPRLPSPSPWRTSYRCITWLLRLSCWVELFQISCHESLTRLCYQ